MNANGATITSGLPTCDDCARTTAGRCWRHQTTFTISDPAQITADYFPVLDRIATALERIAASLETEPR